MCKTNTKKYEIPSITTHPTARDHWRYVEDSESTDDSSSEDDQPYFGEQYSSRDGNQVITSGAFGPEHWV